jgi:hypothetical protein
MTVDGRGDAPPPLPPRRRSPPGAATGIAGDARQFEGLVPEPSGPDRTRLDSRWVYQHEGQLFGPITAKELLEMLYDGALDFDSLVAPDGSELKPVRRFGVFRAHREKIESHRAQIRTAEARVQRERRRLRRRIALALAFAVSVLVVGGAGLRSYMRTSRQAEAERAKALQEARLREEIDGLLARVTVEPPLAPLIDGESSPAAKADGEDSTPRDRNEGRSARAARRRRRAAARAAAAGRPAAAGAELSDAEILQGIGRALPRFKRCIVGQIQRDSASIRDRIVLRFTIGNDGRVRDFSLADRILRASPLQSCLKDQLASVQWRSFRGEVRNVEYPIRINRG